MSEPSARCGSFHIHAGVRCIRHKGHDGLCWSKAQAGGLGSISRCEWYSENGAFKTHHQYNTRYPSNATPDPAKGDGKGGTKQ
jgi:hypothetical protein